MSPVRSRLKPLIAGNWKMNGLISELDEVRALPRAEGVAEVLVCPPATLIAAMADAVAGSAIGVGAQDCHAERSGAHTGDISAEMLAEAGASAIIVGHSERRTDHGETDALVRAKAAAVHRARLTAIICVGETLAQRQANETLGVVSRQLSESLPDAATAETTVVAYEPVWAIGTGLTPTSEDIAAVHAHIRSDLTARFGADGAGIRILYGGSVKPANAREILALPEVGGALVGGASLKASDFAAIISAVPHAT